MPKLQSEIAFANLGFRVHVPKPFVRLAARRKSVPGTLVTLFVATLLSLSV